MASSFMDNLKRVLESRSYVNRTPRAGADDDLTALPVPEYDGPLANTTRDPRLQPRMANALNTLPSAGGRNNVKVAQLRASLGLGADDGGFSQSDLEQAYDGTLEGLPEPVKRVARMKRLGVDVSAADVETPQEREAREARARAVGLEDFRKRQEITQDVADASARRRGAIITPGDRVDIKRWARQDAAAIYRTLTDESGVAPPGTPSMDELTAQIEAEYAAALEPARPGPKQIDMNNLRRIFPGPVGSRQTVPLTGLTPRGSGGTSGAPRTGTAMDPWELYLSR